MCVAVCERHEELYEELDSYIDQVKDKPGILIGVLHKAQEIFGWLPQEVQEHVAEKLNLPVSEVYGVVTFYNHFSTKPKGKNEIKVCLGTACYVKGADRVMDRMLEELGVQLEEVTPDGLFSVHAVRCLGACSMAPVVLVGEKDFYGKVTPDMVTKIISAYKRGGSHE
ncbi:MAG TPA: NAD(P)H-dependent oxidoreductase subunit E [Fervidobacterium sp.]|jgi:NADH-quinone oxidoreductase subunit E|nr:NAD(P)H-dependent oxidoreductase subunit E [Fervidobacterium sp.]MBP9518207.1 NAD(P)H-dependent oxidoreductase subunit E [Fervidobacterium sp.]HOH53911.1 NAD(P)H-dependent oxidoreductase subunit E [Fervidobacterium sp.]HOK33285.1 NAD(P)H-dependent oxidoreductase subunit E [Fervidobacterium sp.]HOL03900.1 NAD(P)H-dependent oxidoreductase subunit E [Fervidobacterium sp.]